ncbi:ferric-chelate reductase, partial [Tremellales sp. Uapishka_1]
GKGSGRGKTPEVFWGGRGAPIFVKAGELFKQGEVDIITVDKDHNLHVKALPLSDPSAPQMSDLADDAEIEILLPEAFTQQSNSPMLTDEAEAAPEIEMEQNHETEIEETSEITTIELLEKVTPALTPEGVSLDTEETVSIEINETPLFFIDTEPEPIPSIDRPTYRTSTAAPLGAHHSTDEDEVVLVPRKYQTPKPISLLRKAPASDPISLPIQVPVETATRNVLSRAEKKAAKREKRRGNKKKNKKGKEGKGAPRYDSDVEWGSNGPPQDGEDEDGDEDENMAVLRDYLAGTLLNAKAEEEDEEEDGEEEELEQEEGVDLEAMRRFGEGMKGLGEQLDMGDEKRVEDDDEVENEELEDGSEWEDEEESVEGDAIAAPAGKDKKNDPMPALNDANQDAGGYSSSISSLDDEDEDAEDDEDDDSSEIGGLNAALDLDESELDSKGEPTHADQTEWFIRDMEEALGVIPYGKSRKQRNKTFAAIQNGDFGDDWGLTPAKKGKSKLQNIPAELQDQWEKDRLKKADRKRQRELERLIAEIDPYPAARKGKGKSKIQQASLAHLIPRSAAEVADLFDVDSDQEVAMPMGKRGRMAHLFPQSLEQIDGHIRDFLLDHGKTTYSLPPMDKEGRKKVHMLAECFGLVSKSRGSGKSRFTVLIKQSRSGMLINETRVAKLLSGGAIKSKFNGSGGGGGGGGAKKKGPPGGAGSSVRHKDGDQVGEGAERIGQDNVGHRLLSKMGWAEGERIGKSGGLEAPIVAIVKNTKMVELFWTAAYCGIVLALALYDKTGKTVMTVRGYANQLGVMASLFFSFGRFVLSLHSQAFAQMPFVVGLASKNNTISFLTGISYQKLNFLHRAAARVCFLLSWLHTIGRLIAGLTDDKTLGETYVQMGIVALVAYCLLVFSSFRIVRKFFYEAFLVVHIVFALVFLISAYIHYPDFGYWLWPSLLIWGLDRLVRLGKVIVLNKLWFLPFASKKDQVGYCTVELVDEDVMRLTMNTNTLSWGAGQHAFVTMPQVARLRYEAHPFSFANIPTEEDGKAVFIIRAQGGFTKRLRDQLTSTSTNTLKAYIDGPYGRAHSLDHNDTVLLISGGTGITYVLSHFLQIIANVRAGRSAVRSLHLVWNVRHLSHIAWIAPLLNEHLQTLPAGLRIRLDVFVTKSHVADEPASREPLSEAIEEKAAHIHEHPEPDAETPGMAGPPVTGMGWSSGSSQSSHEVLDEKQSNEEPCGFGLSATPESVVTTHRGRAVLRDIVEADVRGAQGRMNVTVCGPENLSMSAREAVRQVSTASNIMRGQQSIDFYVEVFGW